VNEKREIANRLREQALAKYGSLKALADAIGKTQQYLNVYLSGINAPGPKFRELLRKAGLDVAYIITGRREGAATAQEGMAQKIYQLMEEKGIKSVDELRERLENEEALKDTLGPDVYSTFLRVAAVREKQAKYKSKKGKRHADRTKRAR
jgi:transcriptional regulator with XRE-family HTH domain